jgi:membrane-bound lytic murein transglycosylase B
MNHCRRIFSIGFFIVALSWFGTATHAHAQTVSSAGGITMTPETVEQREARLKAELAQVEEEQRKTEAVLTQARSESASLQRDVTILNANIKAAKLNIQAKNILIQQLGKDIADKEETISTLDGRIERGHQALAYMLRRTYEYDQTSLPETLLSGNTLAQAFTDVDAYQATSDALQRTFEDIRAVKNQTQTARDALDKRKNSEIDARISIEENKRIVEQNEKEKTSLLTMSRGAERNYETVLATKRARAAQIRAALFSLRDTAAIPFDKALQFANKASASTGVRPAFLLAILTQESALGKNVGSCYLGNTTTGAGVSVKTGNAVANVMKPGRDVEPFTTLMRELGRDPLKTLVSCPQSVGYGGAMGPAQFIPSTWALFRSRLERALGKSVPDPWEPQDAFVASATYLGDLGASSGSYTAERNAACRYYSGKPCAPRSINMTYGTQVMQKAQTIQETMINPLQGV